MLVEDGLNNRLLGESLAGLQSERIRGLVVLNVEAEDVPILDRVGNRIGVELLLKEILGSQKRGDVTLNLLGGRVFLEDRRASEAKELGVGKELLDGFVVLAELRAMTFVKDEHHSLIAERLKPLLER